MADFLQRFNLAKISIIVPVYNSAEYILACLESILAQTYPHWECILIDDCSTDNTAGVITDFMRAHPAAEFRCERNAHNLRQGPSRNRGVALAKGDLLAFVDNDDLLPVTALADLVAAMGTADVVVGNYARFIDSNGPVELIFKGGVNPENFLIPREEGFSNIYNMVYPWAKLYRRTFWLAHQFEFPCEKFEDTIVWPVVSFRANQIAVCDQCVYWHRVGNPNSDGSNIPPVFKLYYDSFAVRLAMLKRYGVLDQENYYISFCLADAYSYIQDMTFSWQRIRMFKLLRQYIPKLPSAAYLATQIIPEYKVKKLKKMYKYGTMYFLLKPKAHGLKRLLSAKS